LLRGSQLSRANSLAHAELSSIDMLPVSAIGLEMVAAANLVEVAALVGDTARATMGRDDPAPVVQGAAVAGMNHNGPSTLLARLEGRIIQAPTSDGGLHSRSSADTCVSVHQSREKDRRRVPHALPALASCGPT
jgi:hypothetical protein